MQLGDARSGATVRSAYGPCASAKSAAAPPHRGVVRFATLGVRRGPAVWLDAIAPHGVVRTDLTADPGPAQGEDTVELHTRTGYGAIAIHRSDGPSTHETR